MVVSISTVAAVAGDRAWLVGGESISGRLVGSEPSNFGFAVAETREVLPLTRLRQINLGASPRSVFGPAPLRRIALVGGESVHAAIVMPAGEAPGFRGFGRDRVALPRPLVARVSQPAGLHVIACDDFESRSALFKGARLTSVQHGSGRQSLFFRDGDGPLEWRPSRPLEAARVTLSFYDDGQASEDCQPIVEFELRDRSRAPGSLQFCPAGTAAEHLVGTAGALSLATTRLERVSGWRQLTLIVDVLRVLLLVDEQVAASGPVDGGALAALKLRFACRSEAIAPAQNAGAAVPAGAAGAAAETGLFIDDLAIYKRAERGVAPVNAQPSDLACLLGGDEVFGKVVEFGVHEAVLEGPFGRLQFPWAELHGLAFAPGARPAGRPVEGIIARVELAPLLGAGEDPAGDDVLIVALKSLSETELAVEHPYLGELVIPRSAVTRIVPEFQGVLWLIDPGFNHLGDSIREDFHVKRADGQGREWKVRLGQVPAGKAFATMRVADLEPLAARAGRPLPRGGKGPVTELFVNGRRIDRLNHYARVRAHSSNPQKLRIAIPAGVLKAGENSVRIEQRPAADNPAEFDDLELSRLAFEFVP